MKPNSNSPTSSEATDFARYAQKAREMYANDSVSIETAPVISHTQEGAWVQAWVFVPDTHEWWGGYLNPLAAALACAERHGISSTAVGDAILQRATGGCWSFNEDDILEAIAMHTNIVVQRLADGSYRVCLDA